MATNISGVTQTRPTSTVNLYSTENFILGGQITVAGGGG
jgi:hypothetical protein